MTYDRTGTSPTVPPGIVLGPFLALYLLAYLNEIFDWRITGSYDWEWIVVMTLLGVAALPLFIRFCLRR